MKLFQNLPAELDQYLKKNYTNKNKDDEIIDQMTESEIFDRIFRE
ncbi:hypothetical protein M153_8960003767, partial [Pseudoloma neurophilia]